jgi:hypothetical protein
MNVRQHIWGVDPRGSRLEEGAADEAEVGEASRADGAAQEGRAAVVRRSAHAWWA